MACVHSHTPPCSPPPPPPPPLPPLQSALERLLKHTVVAHAALHEANGCQGEIFTLKDHLADPLMPSQTTS